MQAPRGEKTQGSEQLDDASVEEVLRLVEAANLRSRARRRRRSRRRVLVLLIAIVALLAVVAYRVEFWAAGDAQTPKVGSSAGANGPATRSIPDFVWVAVKGAARYRIEFFRGARVVHTATTSVPRLHVAAATLPPGRYRWRVWALEESGARIGAPVVDASVNIR